MEKARLDEIRMYTDAIGSTGTADESILTLMGFVYELLSFAGKHVGTRGAPTDFRFKIPRGTEPSQCRSCKSEIFWIKTKKGKNMPTNPDGTSHFATCPEADRYRR
jgi:hypothetical protein